MHNDGACAISICSFSSFFIPFSLCFERSALKLWSICDNMNDVVARTNSCINLIHVLYVLQCWNYVEYWIYWEFVPICLCVYRVSNADIIHTTIAQTADRLFCVSFSFGFDSLLSPFISNNNKDLELNSLRLWVCFCFIHSNVSSFKGILNEMHDSDIVPNSIVYTITELYIFLLFKNVNARMRNKILFQNE